MTTISKSDCQFYHTIELPNETISADWDLRPCINDYLGRVDFRGKTVLDIGAATGFLSFHAEKMGGAVTSFDTDSGYDLVNGWDKSNHIQTGIQRVKNAYHYCHQKLGSKAEARYGDVYHLDRLEKHFDVAILGSILLHLENPVGAIRSACAVADTVIITDVVRNYLPQEIVFRPGFPNPDELWWWYLPPKSVARMAQSFGFNPAEPIYLKATSPTYGTIDLYSIVASKVIAKTA